MFASRKSKRGHSTDLSAQKVHARRELADQRIGLAVVETLEARRLLNALSFASSVPFSLTASPTSVIVADYNGDGKPDLISADSNSSVNLLQGNGDGTFQQPAKKLSDGLTAGTAFVVAANIAPQYSTTTTQLDLIVASQTGSNVSVLLGRGASTFNSNVEYTAAPSGADTYSLAVADLNGDGKPDIITGNTNNSVSVLLGEGNGTFYQPYNSITLPNSAGGSITVAAGKLSSNGPELVAAANTLNNDVTLLEFTAAIGSSKSSSTYSYTVVGTFPTGDFPNSVAVGDVNKDGIADVVVGSADGKVTVILSNANGTFKALAPVTIGVNVDSVAIADMDGDGNPDIIAAGNTTSPTAGGVTVLFGNGTGNFAIGPNSSVVVGTSNNSPRAVAGDLNGDGHPDLITTNYSGSAVTVRLNTVSSGGTSGQPGITETGGVVSAVGTPTNDSIVVSVNAGSLVLTINSTTQSFPLSSVNSIKINGGAGNDSITIEAGVPAIFVNGAGGADTIIAQNNAPDTLVGGKGKDSILGGGAETLPGGGNMLLVGGRGADTIVAGTGNSTVLGGGASDSLTGGNGNSLIEGGNGNDSLLASSGAINLGDDTITASSGGSTLIGGAGNDSITGSSHADLLLGGSGNDTLVAGAAILAPAGFPNVNTLIGGGGFDLLVGSGGGSDLLRGGPGNDTLVGAITTTGTDTLYGGAGGFDSIQGGVRDFIQNVAGDTITRNGASAMPD